LPQAIRIAQRTRAIALQSVLAGLGMSLAGMAAAALGYLSPLQGAILQEAIDVAVILNALRALGHSSAMPTSMDKEQRNRPSSQKRLRDAAEKPLA